ncbi:MAG: DUF1998 domain-containing protein, partial [Planctomycetota bacterium]
ESLLALREYAPGSRILVGGRVVHSRGILRHWSGGDGPEEAGLSARVGECRRGHRFTWLVGDEHPCTVCGAPLAAAARWAFFPQHGFTTAAWDPPHFGYRARAVGDVSVFSPDVVLGVGEAAEAAEAAAGCLVRHDVAGVAGLRAEYREEGTILVLNEGNASRGFAICHKCGYADSERHVGDGRVELPPRFADHPPVDSFVRTPCWERDEAPVWRNRVLAARDTTDLLFFDPRETSLAADAVPAPEKRAAVAQTIAAALEQAGAELLEVDPRELGSLTLAEARGPCDPIVLYDNVPGGVGHVRVLLECAREWLERARARLRGDDEHHERCDSACLDCILRFDSPQEGLRRRDAFRVLDAWLGGR